MRIKTHPHWQIIPNVWSLEKITHFLNENGITKDEILQSNYYFLVYTDTEVNHWDDKDE